MQLVQKVAEARDENELLSQALQELQASSCHPFAYLDTGMHSTAPVDVVRSPMLLAMHTALACTFCLWQWALQSSWS